MSTQTPGMGPNEDTLGQRVLRTFTGVVGAVAILSVAALLNPSWGPWTQLALIPLVLSVGALLCVTVGRVLLRARRSRTARLVAGLTPLLGQGWDAQHGLTASRFSRGRPRRVKIDYPDTIADHDPEWRRRVEEMVRQRMEVEKVTSSWDTRRGRVVFTAKTQTTENDRAEARREAAQQRVHDILRPMFGTEIHVAITEWENEKKEETA